MTCSNSESVVKITLCNGAVTCTGILDSGADVTVISKKVSNELRSKRPQLTTTKLEDPIILELPNHDHVKIWKAIDVDITSQTK